MAGFYFALSLMAWNNRLPDPVAIAPKSYKQNPAPRQLLSLDTISRGDDGQQEPNEG